MFFVAVLYCLLLLNLVMAVWSKFCLYILLNVHVKIFALSFRLHSIKVWSVRHWLGRASNSSVFGLPEHMSGPGFFGGVGFLLG